MKRKKIAIAGVGLLAVLSAGVFTVMRDIPYMRNIELHGINLTSVNSGRYNGAFERGRFAKSVTVRIENNQIVEITDNDARGTRLTDISNEVFSRVIEAQDTIIDAVSGATATTNAYLKAIENAISRE